MGAFGGEPCIRPNTLREHQIDPANDPVARPGLPRRPGAGCGATRRLGLRQVIAERPELAGGHRPLGTLYGRSLNTKFPAPVWLLLYCLRERG